MRVTKQPVSALKFEKHGPGDPMLPLHSFPYLHLLMFPTLSLDRCFLFFFLFFGGKGK